jgi:hypothetical protein
MKTIKKTLPVILLLITLAFIGSSCGGDDDTPNEPKKVRLTKFEGGISSSVFEFIYDDNNTITKYNETIFNTLYEYPINYDSYNNVIKLKNRIYIYNNQNELIQIKTLGSFAPSDATITVNAEGLMTALSYYVGSDLVTRTFTYNSNNQLIEFTDNKEGDTFTRKSNITYDSKGNVAQIENGIVNALNGIFTTSSTVTFTYNDSINPFFEIAKKLEKKPNQTSTILSFYIGTPVVGNNNWLYSDYGTYMPYLVSPNTMTSVNRNFISSGNYHDYTFTINSINSQNYPTSVSVSASGSIGTYSWDETYTYEEY